LASGGTVFDSVSAGERSAAERSPEERSPEERSTEESERIGVASSGWLRAARCSALICTITYGVAFAVGAAQDIMAALLSVGRSGLLSLALLYLLFRRGKNALAFALGLGAATAFIALLAVASIELHLARMFNLVFIIGFYSGITPPLLGDSPKLATLGVLLLWVFSISSAMLGLSSIVAFQKMAHEAKETGKLRLAFGAGICCVPVVWLIFIAAWLLLVGGFHM
jgi:hypothetical protein